MWQVSSNSLTMVEGDFGVILPIVISGVTFAAGDEVKLVILKKLNGTEIISKTFQNIQKNTVNLELTANESAQLPAVGTYVYRLDWYQDGVFMCNIIPSAPFKVVEKA